MGRRATKHELHEHRITCPYCRSDIIVYSLMEHSIAACRICPKCKREILIHDGKAVRATVKGVKKLPKRSHSSEPQR